MDRLRLGVIGCGAMVRTHVKELVAREEVEFVALADVNPAMAESFRQETLPEEAKDIPLFHDYREMIDQVELDGVIISTPHRFHYEQLKHSLQKGLHILVEKPMVCDVAQARELIELERQVGKVLVVAYQRRYQPHYRYIKAAIQAGELGGIKMAVGLMWQPWAWFVSQRSPWRADPKVGLGGMLTDSGSHLVDALLWTTGLRAREVFALVDNGPLAVDVYATLAIKFAGGAIGSISTTGTGPRPLEEDLSLYGSKGSIHLRSGAVFQQEAERALKKVRELPAGSSPAANFLDAVLGRDEVRSLASEALRVTELTQAAYQSAAIGRPVFIG